MSVTFINGVTSCTALQWLDLSGVREGEVGDTELAALSSLRHLSLAGIGNLISEEDPPDEPEQVGAPPRGYSALTSLRHLTYLELGSVVGTAEDGALLSMEHEVIGAAIQMLTNLRVFRMREWGGEMSPEMLAFCQAWTQLSALEALECPVSQDGTLLNVAADATSVWPELRRLALRFHYSQPE
jgi:hypothetical protein